MRYSPYLFLLSIPLFVAGYFLCSKIRPLIGKLFLCVTGAVFCVCCGGVRAAAVLAVSIAGNAVAGVLLTRQRHGRTILTVAIAANVALLLWFQYAGIVLGQLRNMGLSGLSLPVMALPLGFGFVTLQQIMFLIALYRQRIRMNLVDYLTYILYAPKLIMGPLMKPRDFFHQINDAGRKRFRADHIPTGLKLFCFGLFKKLLLADTFFRAVSWGFAHTAECTAGDVCLLAVCCTFALYFDFSGYCDMAAGVSRMINITLPINFDSPLKAYSVREFWQRWHISLVQFLKEHIYNPLGGGERGGVITCLNLMVAATVGALWHGARWTLLLWGILIGALLSIDTLLEKPLGKVHNGFRWLCTLLVMNLLFLLYRSESVPQWLELLGRMFSFQNMNISAGMLDAFVLPETSLLFDLFGLTTPDQYIRGFSMILWTLFAFVICMVPENNARSSREITLAGLLLSAAAFIWSFLCLGGGISFLTFAF